MGVAMDPMDYVPEYAHVLLTCREPGCLNENVEIELEEYDLQGSAICGPCGKMITDVLILSRQEPEADHGV